MMIVTAFLDLADEHQHQTLLFAKRLTDCGVSLLAYSEGRRLLQANNLTVERKRCRAALMDWLDGK
jgi:hypothetical protein